MKVLEAIAAEPDTAEFVCHVRLVPGADTGKRVTHSSRCCWGLHAQPFVYQGDGQSAPASTQALMRAPNSCCVPGTGARPTPGCQPQPTSESSAMW